MLDATGTHGPEGIVGANGYNRLAPYGGVRIKIVQSPVYDPKEQGHPIITLEREGPLGRITYRHNGSSISHSCLPLPHEDQKGKLVDIVVGLIKGRIRPEEKATLYLLANGDGFHKIAEQSVQAIRNGKSA